MEWLFRKAVLWFTNTKFFNWLLLKVIPYIRFSFYYTSIRGRVYHAGYKRVRAGDIILTRDNKKLTTLLIGGEFTHASLFLGPVMARDGTVEFEVAEMTHNHFTKSWFFDLCKEADRVVILRCMDFDAQYVQDVVNKCLSFAGAKYDTGFTLGVQALYCSELVYQSDFERRLRVSLEDIAGLGCEYISPTGLYHAQNCVVVWDSTKEKL